MQDHYFEFELHLQLFFVGCHITDDDIDFVAVGEGVNVWDALKACLEDIPRARAESHALSQKLNYLIEKGSLM